MLRVVTIKVASPNGDVSPEELASIRDVLTTMEDWQLMGENEDAVGNFRIEATGG